MYRDIRKKKLILESRRPYEAELNAEIREIDLIDMIYSNFRLSGIRLEKEQIKAIMHGNVIREATIEEHTIVNNYVELYYTMNDMLEMGSGLNMKTLMAFYSCICDSTEDGYRKTNPIVHEFSYNPPHFKEIEEQMQNLMSITAREDRDDMENELMKAVRFHNRLIAIYPFENHNEELARICLWFYMKSKGYPVFFINLSEQEYNTAIAGYIKTGDFTLMYNGMERSLYNKMEHLYILTSIE